MVTQSTIKIIHLSSFSVCDHEEPPSETKRFPRGRGKVKVYVHHEVPHCDQEEPHGDYEKPHRETKRLPRGRGKVKVYIQQEDPHRDQEEPHGETKRSLTVRPRGASS